MPEVSVIIPNYNHASYLRQRIDSVLGQTYQNFELIILDDCSTDNSKNIIESYQNHPNISSIIYNETNSGTTFQQWLKGIALAKGNYIWIAESDDYSDPKFIESGIEALQQNSADIFYCKSVRVDEKGNFVDDLSWWLDDLNNTKWKQDYNASTTDDLPYLIRKNFICNTSSVIFKNEAIVMEYIRAVVSFKYCGDWLFWLQYFVHYKEVCFSTEVTNYYRWHPNTTRAQIDYKRNTEMLTIYQWIQQNILHKESLSLLQYFFNVHLYMHSRKQVIKQLRFLIDNYHFSNKLPIALLKFYSEKI